MRSLNLTLVALAGLLLLPGCSDDTKKPTVDFKVTPVPESGATEKGGGTADNIFDVNKGVVGDGATVTLKDMVVTAVGGKTVNVFAQDPKGGEYSGLMLYKPTRTDGVVADLKAGDHITVQGKVQHFNCATCSTQFYNGKKLIEVVNATISKLKSDTPPAPKVLSAADAVKEDTSAIKTNPWQHVLITIQNQTMGCYSLQYSDLAITGDLSVDPELFNFTPPEFGSCKSVTGVLAYFYNYYIYVRAQTDFADGTGCPTLNAVKISDIRGGSGPANNSLVKVSGTITAVATYAVSSSGGTPKYTGFWVQEAGTTKAGIYVYYTWTDAVPAEAKPKAGDNVEVYGTYTEFKASGAKTDNTLAEIGDSCFKSTGAGTVPTPVVIADPTTIATNGSAVKDYEGMLVEVDNVKVGDVVQTTGTTPKTVGFKLDPSSLYVENTIFDFVSSAPAKGTTLTKLIGVLQYAFDNYMILPRSAADIVKQ
jgi:hypothetical protein